MANTFEVQQYINNNIKYFNKEHLNNIKEMIEKSNKSMIEINSIKLKSPSLCTVLSVIFGLLGIDRFYAGNYLYGFIKLSTCGICGIGWILDWFIIGKSIKTENYINLYCSLCNGNKNNIKKIYTKRIIDAFKSKEGRKLLTDVVRGFKDINDSFFSS